jgi:hypothetical protein
VKREPPAALLTDVLRDEFPPFRVVPGAVDDPDDRALIALAGAMLALVALCGGVVATGAGRTLRRA